MKLLLTGATGFVGRHFTQQMPATPLDGSDGNPVELTDRAAVVQAVDAVKPDAVIHMAAQAFVPDSFDDPHATFQTNVLGTLNLLFALKKTGFKGRVVYVGSAEVYGRVREQALPIREEQAIRPRNPYAASKAAAEALAYQWSQTGGFEVVLTRPFNHAGPGQSDRFVVSQFARQVAEIKNGSRPAVLEVGDIDVTRDFSDVRDVVRAYRLLLERGRSGEAYNICSGTESNVREILNQLLALAGVEAEIRVQRDRLRPDEQRRMVGSRDKIEAETGWAPQISLATTLADTLAYWGDTPR